MKTFTILNPEQGIERIVQATVAGQENKPFLISVHGGADSGKQELIHQAVNQLYERYHLQGFVGENNGRFGVDNTHAVDYVLLFDFEAPELTERLFTYACGRKQDLKVYVAHDMTEVGEKVRSLIMGGTYNLVILNLKIS